MLVVPRFRTGLLRSLSCSRPASIGVSPRRWPSSVPPTSPSSTSTPAASEEAICAVFIDSENFLQDVQHLYARHDLGKIVGAIRQYGEALGRVSFMQAYEDVAHGGVHAVSRSTPVWLSSKTRLLAALEEGNVRIRNFEKDGRKNDADYLITDDVLRFAYEHPGAKAVLLTGDGDFAYVAEKVSQHIDIHLVLPSTASPRLWNLGNGQQSNVKIQSLNDLVRMITSNSLGDATKAPEEVKVEPTSDYVWVDTQQYGSLILKNDKNQDAIDEIESNNEVKVRIMADYKRFTKETERVFLVAITGMPTEVAKAKEAVEKVCTLSLQIDKAQTRLKEMLQKTTKLSSSYKGKSSPLYVARKTRGKPGMLKISGRVAKPKDEVVITADLVTTAVEKETKADATMNEAGPSKAELELKS